MTTRRPPSTCPVCSGELMTTRLGCPDCGTELVGAFTRCNYCSLSDEDHEILRVFLMSRGNLKELEKYLGVSYPTARARFNALLDTLGLGDDDPGTGEGQAHSGAIEDDGERGAAPGSPAGPPPTGSARDQVLAQVASGALSPEVAADLLRRLR
ncbi:MAG: DUF2089 domain-containing protein [Propioniciclava sp.]